MGNSKQWLRVFVRRGKRWARVWQRVVTPYRYESPKDGSTTLYQPTVRVLRPARGRFALLMVEHVETMPGIGHHATLALSVRLDPS